MRKDYFNDPDAPKANAAVPSVTAVVVDDGRILLVHRAAYDDRRCLDKYGRAWQAYCARVPYRMIPFVY